MRAGNYARKRWRLAVQGTMLMLLGIAPWLSFAQSTYGEEAKTRLQTAQRFAPLADESFGERISLYNGTASFRFVDISLPSNNNLKVELARLIDAEFSLNFWAWVIDVPKITSVLPTNWQGGWTPDPPETVSNADSVEFFKEDYWNGFRLQVDGTTSQLLYRSTDARVVTPPGSADFRFMTKAAWTFKVVPAPSGIGSALIGYAPNGNRYFFDHLVTDLYAGSVEHQTAFRIVRWSNQNGSGTEVFPSLLPRSTYVLYVSKIEDRFGNWVKYEWEGTQLKRIHANDGREIVITSEKVTATTQSEDPRYILRRATANGRTWTYNQAGGEVVNPDGSKWRGAVFDFGHINYKRTFSFWDGLVFREQSLLHDILYCVKAYDFVDNQVRTLSITHPSSATATYQFIPMRHGRTNVPERCRQRSDDTRTWNTALPMYDDTWTLFRRTVSGPGIPTVETSYGYEGLDPQFATSAQLGSPPNYKTVTVRETSGEYQEHVFGRDWGLNEGQLLSVREYNAQNILMRRTENTYLPVDNVSQAFPPYFGSTGIARTDGLGDKNLPVIRTAVTQDSHTFNWQVSADCGAYCFDYLVRPTKVVKSSAPAP